MPDMQLASLTIKSHGARVARLHMYDWIILVLLAVTDGLLNIIEPFHRFVGKDMMTDLRYPMKSNTVPFWAVPVCAFAPLSCNLLMRQEVSFSVFSCFVYFDFNMFVFLQIIGIVLPIVIIVAIYFKKRNVYDLHHAILGILHMLLFFMGVVFFSKFLKHGC